MLRHRFRRQRHESSSSSSSSSFLRLKATWIGCIILTLLLQVIASYRQSNSIRSQDEKEDKSMHMIRRKASRFPVTHNNNSDKNSSSSFLDVRRSVVLPQGRLVVVVSNETLVVVSNETTTTTTMTMIPDYNGLHFESLQGRADNNASSSNFRRTIRFFEPTTTTIAAATNHPSTGTTAVTDDNDKEEESEECQPSRLKFVNFPSCNAFHEVDPARNFNILGCVYSSKMGVCV